MRIRLLLPSVLAATLALAAVPAFAEEAATGTATDATRVERCKRFANDDDYERCVRLIRRLPPKEAKNESTVEASTPTGLDWKWTNILNRIEAKVKSTVKFVSVMAQQFCKDRTDENETTSRECMGQLKEELKKRIDTILDETFRGDLPSSR